MNCMDKFVPTGDMEQDRCTLLARAKERNIERIRRAVRRPEDRTEAAEWELSRYAQDCTTLLEEIDRLRAEIAQDQAARREEDAIRYARTDPFP